MGFVQDDGQAVRTFCANGEKVAPSAMASVGSLQLLDAQVGAQYGVHESLGLTNILFIYKLMCTELVYFMPSNLKAI